MLRVRSNEALDYWMDRLTREQIFSELIRLDPTQPRRLVFEDFENHKVELIVSDAKDKPLAFPVPDIPEQFHEAPVSAKERPPDAALLPGRGDPSG